MIKSPLRYPGGKARAIKKIIKHLPKEFGEQWEYREPFVGGGSLFIYLKQTYPNLKIWINDLNPELYYFWKVAQSDLEQLVSEVRKVKASCTDGKGLFRDYLKVKVEYLSDLERAVRFFVLNRISFSGTVESGGFSQQAFLRRFTNSSIDRLAKLAPVLQDVQITNLDYSEVLKPDGERVFIFLDPPYLVAKKSKLYGKDGDLHTSFEHQRFAQEMKACSHRWLITYDDSLEIRKNFEFAQIFEWELQYGMNNYKQASAQKGKELFITNSAEIQRFALLSNE
ncbi:DNA adenine methylase [Roseofilum capinflatum]|uniref:site-specific DNA-methyltransferase (adenine-specific) n=1 Tax=Roseofilum capinflatum BLCC-M114 TaxID=3022440 RepID=A0ABT7B5D4_9CYAN|nr:DNA adenine methylase [Roseofilum capinflatum]MDJ1173839.1 DNA adenine methylase [Roseofilum capinflatum BLCC-M114]